MKLLLLLLFISIAGITIAQTHLFLRVYDLNGQKIAKGQLTGLTDTSLQVERNGVAQKIEINNIGFINTKRSGGHNVLDGAILGAVVFAIVGAATAQPSDPILGYNAGEGAMAGLVVGLPIGALIGALTIPLKKSKTYQIDGDIAKWQIAKAVLEKGLLQN